MTHRPTHREAQAEAEIGHTVFGRGVALGMCVFFLLTLAILLGGELLHRRADGARGGAYVLDATQAVLRSAGQLPSQVKSEGLWEGLGHTNRAVHAQMDALETGLQMGSPWRLPLLTPMNQWLSGTLGASNANVYVGKEDWLFYGPALRHVVGPPIPTPSNDSLGVLVAFQAALAERGIALVVVPVPSKVSLYPESFHGRIGDGVVPRNQGYGAWLKSLEAAGVVVFDPTPALVEGKEGGPVYLRRDSHWSPRGVEYCAEALSEFLDAQFVFSDATRRAYRRGSPSTVAYRGDLAAMLYPDPVAGALVEEWPILPVEDSDGNPWQPEVGSEVLLLGDSFTNIYSQEGLGWGTGAGLAEQLSLHLQRPVDRIAQNDHGAYAARHRLQDAVSKGEERLAETGVVVYEFAVRELSWGDWKPNRNMALDREGAAPLERGVKQTVTGRVRARSLPPAPRSVPYKDCLISVILEPDLPDGEAILFYTQGMVDHRWTTATTWNVGDLITVPLTPWTDVSNALESLNRMAVEGEEACEGAPWWYGDGAVDTQAAPVIHTGPLEVGKDVGAPLEVLIAQKEAAGEMVIPGQENWLYFVPELRSLSVGAFWGESAPTVSRARNAQWADPLAAIVDFNRQLAAAGVTLLVVPVPAKAAVYPEFLDGEALTTTVEEQAGAQGAHRRFLQVLRSSGVQIVDLQPLFEASREGSPYYCQTDTHWSPAGAALAAGEVAKTIRALPGFVATANEGYSAKTEELVIHGDLAALAGMTDSTETLPFTRVSRAEGGQLVPVPVDRKSPVLLMGDSHNLVFHAGGDMHATGGGLPDHLALELGRAVDLVAVRGSGATTPRINLARRGDQLAGKNVVVWCFAAREFTESVTGWRAIPVIP